MPTYTKLTTVSELPTSDEAKEFSCGDKTICVANVNGTFSAMDNVCLHRGGPLGEGELDGTTVVCPWHGWSYDISTGCKDDEPDKKVACFAVKVEGDDILIEA